MPPPSRYEEKVVGLYLSMADDTVEGYETDSDWNPELYEYQQVGANLLLFAFINPANHGGSKVISKVGRNKRN